MEAIKNGVSRKELVQVLIWILVFGSLWGLSEVALGGALKAAAFPYRAGLLTGIGMGIMGMALALSRKSLLPVGVGAVAVLVGLLVVPVLHVSAMCKANSSLALIIEAGSLSLAAGLITRKTGASVYGRMVTGFSAALLASAAFYFAGVHFAPCAYLLSFTPGSFVVKEGLVWAAFSGILLPIGYAAGERLAASTFPAFNRRSWYYSGSAVALCWGISALAIAAGL